MEVMIKMNNKVLITVTLPNLNQKFDIFVPVNEVIWKLKKEIILAIQDLYNINLTYCDYVLMNVDNSNIYRNNTILIETDIRNSSNLILIPIK